MDAGSHTSHSDAHITTSQTLTSYHTFCIKMLIFIPPVLPSERKTVVTKLILCPQWKTERTLLGVAICAGLGLNDLQKALQWIGYWAKNRSWESWCLVLYSQHKCCLLSLYNCCLLPNWALRHTTGLWCSKRTHCPCGASFRNLPSATLQEPCAGNYENSCSVSSYFSITPPVLSASIFMPGILQEFAFCRLKRKKNEKDKGKRWFCVCMCVHVREKMKGFVIIV